MTSLRLSFVPVLALEGGEVFLVEPKSAAGAAARVALQALDPNQSRAAVRAMLERAGETRGRARVRLARDEALVRRVSMPAATEENLAQVVGFEMDRLTPFRAEDVYFDQNVVSRDAAAGQIGMELAVARRDLVDARVARLRELGVNVQGVNVADANGQLGAGLDLLPSEQRGDRETANERLVKRLLAAIVVVLIAVALLLPAWQKRESVIALYPLVDKARKDAEATDVLARQLERQVADYNFLFARKHAPPALAYLEDISRLFPDNTWVQQFDLRTVGKVREVQVTGETASSSRLIEILEQSTLVQNAAPRGSVTRGTQPGMERFMIAAETRPRPLPEARPVSEVAILPAPAPSVPPQAKSPAAEIAEPGEARVSPDGQRGEPAQSADSRPPVPALLQVAPGPLTSPAAPIPPPAELARRRAEAAARREAMMRDAKARNEEFRARRDPGSPPPPEQAPRQ